MLMKGGAIMALAKEGNRAQIHYTGKLEDGTVFDSSEGREPLEFTIGSGEVIPGFENAVVGMEVGEKKTERIPAEDAYGPYQEEMVLWVERSTLPEGLDPHVGQMLQMHSEDGTAIPVVVMEISDDGITLDANHPLAGKDLIFEIELVGVA
jgi:peptidylprolyl isomerase